jgi:RIO-like serine/threonine protein kinase
MRLDLSAFRYLTTDDFRVLTSIEMGMRNHEIVPVDLIEQIAKLKRVSVTRVLANLLKHKLIEHSNLKYDGYSLNYIGYDFLAINALMKRGVFVKLGPKLGVGKESDVFICYVNANYVDKIKQDKEISEEEYNKIKAKLIENEEAEINTNLKQDDDDEDEEDESGEINSEDEEKADNKDSVDHSHEEEDFHDNKNEVDNLINKFTEDVKILDIPCHVAVIKLARLGRTSFRSVKAKRDYVKNKSHYNWLYLSRLSAVNEYKYLSGLYEEKFPVPKPYDHNRHVILMEYIPSYSLCRIDDLGNKEKAYNDLISIIMNMANKGLIHGDFNEFNILVEVKTQKMFVIDFPQMISIAHEEAQKYFTRDVKCINKFFLKKFGMTFDNDISTAELSSIVNRNDYLDVRLKAYGHEVILTQMEKESKEQMRLNRQAKNDEVVEEEEEEVKSHVDEFEDEFDLDYGKELESKEKETLTLILTEDFKNKEKIEIDSKSIKDKVKKLLLKEIKKQLPKNSNRFKGKKNEKVKI